VRSWRSVQLREGGPANRFEQLQDALLRIRRLHHGNLLTS
jgi:hypothetical protein